MIITALFLPRISIAHLPHKAKDPREYISVLGQVSRTATNTNFAPKASILSLSKDAVPGQKRPFSKPVTLRQAQRDYASVD
jgi:hypothetical protein